MSAPRVGWRSLLRPLTDNRWVLLMVRFALGGLLITSGVSKLHDIDAFREALLAYGMLPHTVGTLYAAVLPWVELLIGCCLVLGVFLLFASALTIPLVLSFTIANIYAMVHPIGAAADCSCLGSLVSLSHPASLAIDFAMLVAAGLLVVGGRRGGAISLSSMVDAFSFRMDGRMRFALKISSLAVLIVVIAAATPVNSVLAEEGVDDALKHGMSVGLFVYEGDDDLRQESPSLNHVEVAYSQMYVVRLRYGDARSEVRQFGLKTLPTLLLITGKSRSGEYVVAATFEGSLDEAAVRQVIDNLLSQ